MALCYSLKVMRAMQRTSKVPGLRWHVHVPHQRFRKGHPTALCGTKARWRGGWEMRQGLTGVKKPSVGGSVHVMIQKGVQTRVRPHVRGLYGTTERGNVGSSLLIECALAADAALPGQRGIGDRVWLVKGSENQGRCWACRKKLSGSPVGQTGECR
ncbi:hypothetical protein BCR34DRAFT_183073 [Clohesyomyces aquaticus]|uniref:Uncharacterized protein n=1 Tax=Clohesyomyces aquaticus TaxID=1231657 RepID=A0A1Y1ZYH5_9PLEO|nr:hypothetical protein BCR34DRAFT_183073 [Clohesyomyces aquaticus]